MRKKRKKRELESKKTEDRRVKYFLLETLNNIITRLKENEPKDKAGKKRHKAFKKDIKINFRAIEEDTRLA